MITTTDASNIVYEDCIPFGISTFLNGGIPDGEISEERITIHAKEQTTGTYWNKCFIEVNFCVPDKCGEADLVRLQEMERMAVKQLESVGEFDGSHYRYSVYSHSVQEDKPLKCHYVNVRLLFEVLNVN